MSEKKVFLSGAIENVENYGRSWRLEAEKQLVLHGYQVLNPMSLDEPEFNNPQEIVYRNLFMQKQADLLLVEYMLPSRNYVGTDFELTWAKFNEQPSIVFACEENASRIYLQYLASKITYSLDEALLYLVSNYR